MNGRLIGIARVAALRAPPEELTAATIGVVDGLEGDARGRKKDRQVTVLFREGWEDACHEAGATLPWVTRRANLYVEDLVFPREADWQLVIGDVVLEVTMETAPCQLMERAQRGLRRAMTPDWRGGVSCRVIAGGRIALGDAVELRGV